MLEKKSRKYTNMPTVRCIIMIFILVINGIHNINGVNGLNQNLLDGDEYDNEFTCGLIENETESKLFFLHYRYLLFLSFISYVIFNF